MLSYLRNLGFNSIANKVLSTPFVNGVRYEATVVATKVIITKCMTFEKQNGDVVEDSIPIYRGFIDSERYARDLVRNLGIK